MGAAFPVSRSTPIWRGSSDRATLRLAGILYKVNPVHGEREGHPGPGQQGTALKQGLANDIGTGAVLGGLLGTASQQGEAGADQIGFRDGDDLHLDNFASTYFLQPLGLPNDISAYRRMYCGLPRSTFLVGASDLGADLVPGGLAIVTADRHCVGVVP